MSIKIIDYIMNDLDNRIYTSINVEF